MRTEVDSGIGGWDLLRIGQQQQQTKSPVRSETRGSRDLHEIEGTGDEDG